MVALLRIRDIFVWIRIRGSVMLTNGSVFGSYFGSGFGSCYSRGYKNRAICGYFCVTATD
jgi:hypothetical protein